MAAEENIISLRIQNKYDTPENWATSTLILKSGELGFDSTGRAKVGDGNHIWNELPYINDTNRITMTLDESGASNVFTIGPDITKRIYYFNVTKNTTLNFTNLVDEHNQPDKLFFIEKRIYIENSGPNEIELTLGGNAEWANDADGTEWGKSNQHLYLQATWIGGRIIVEVIDNDQLADNTLV